MSPVVTTVPVTLGKVIVLSAVGSATVSVVSCVSSVPPSKIKKYATGKEKSNKELMYNAFCEEPHSPPDLHKYIKPKSNKLTNPTTDIVDAYWICKYGWEDFNA